MNPASILALLQALQAVAQATPAIVELVQNAKSTMGETDQAAIDAAILRLRAVTSADVDQAVRDLGGAG